MTDLLVPPLAARLLTDPEMTAALEPRPARPDHLPGAGIPGCTEFPVGWTDDAIAEASDLAVRDSVHFFAGELGVFHPAIQHGGGRAAVLGRRSADRSGYDPLSAWPVYGTNRHTYRPHRNPLACARIYRRMFAVIEESIAANPALRRNRPQIRWLPSAVDMYRAGRIGDAFLWLLEVVHETRTTIPESVLATLHTMAVRGLFCHCADLPASPEQVVAALWAQQYPTTWGLPHDRARLARWIILDRDTLPDQSTLVAAAERWLRLLTPQGCDSGIDIVDAPEPGFPEGFVISARIRSAVARMTMEAAATPDDPLSVEYCTATVRHGGDPRARLAGLAVELALSETAPLHQQTFPVPADFVPDRDAEVFLDWILDRRSLADLTVVAVDA